MAPEYSDELLGDVWNCELDEDAAEHTATEFQDLLQELVYDLVDA